MIKGIAERLQSLMADRHGIAALEFALLAPLLLVLLVGALECGELIASDRRVNQVAESVVRAANTLVTQPTATSGSALTSANAASLMKITQLTLGTDVVSQVSLFRYLKVTSGDLQLTNSWAISGNALDAPTTPVDLASSFNVGQSALVAKVCYVYHSQFAALVDGFQLCGYYAHSAVTIF